MNKLNFDWFDWILASIIVNALLSYASFFIGNKLDAIYFLMWSLIFTLWVVIETIKQIGNKL